MMIQFRRSEGKIFPAPGARTSAGEDSQCLSSLPPEQHHFTGVHSHLHSFFPHSAISPLFHLHARCEDHSSAQKKKEKKTGAAGGGGRTTQVPLSRMTRYSYINVFSFPILFTLPKLGITNCSKCVRSSTSCSKRNTC